MDDDDDDDGDGDGDGDGGDDVVEISSVQVPGSKSTFPRSTPVPVSVGGLLAGAMVPCHAQVLAKGSALHKSCLRGKLLLFDPTSSLQPCRTVKIHRQAALRPSSWPERPLR